MRLEIVILFEMRFPASRRKELFILRTCHIFILLILYSKLGEHSSANCLIKNLHEIKNTLPAFSQKR